MSDFEARVERLGRQGEGAIEYQGRTHYLEGALPGDHIRASLDRRGKARLLEVLEPSAHRIPSACGVAELCGGCPLISLDYERAAREKERALNDAAGTESARIHRSPLTLGYRRRARLAFDTSRGRLGYRGRRSRAIVDIPACPILTPALEAALPRLRELLGELKGRGEIILGDTLDGVYATIDAGTFQNPGAYRAIEALASSEGWAGVALRAGGVDTLSISGRETERYLGADGLPLETPPGGFLQVNAEINALLARRVAEWAAPEGANIVELFSGAGNLSVLLARGARSLHAIEEYAPASALARENLEARGLSARLKAAKAEEAPLGRADVLVLNPPRSGFRELGEALRAAAPDRVVLVSCDLGSFQRELRTLAREGYTLEEIEGFDMFPRTPHLEAAAKLRRTLAVRPR